MRMIEGFRSTTFAVATNESLVECERSRDETEAPEKPPMPWNSIVLLTGTLLKHSSRE